MNKQELIENLKQHGAWCTECHDINGEKDRYVKVAKVRELLDQLDVPKTEKVEVPQFVADWFENNKDNLNFNIWSYIHRWLSTKDTEFKSWFAYSDYNKPIETLIRMKDGYTVKQEPKWVISYRNSGNNEMYLVSSSLRIMSNGKLSVSWGSKGQTVKFTDKEKTEALAALIDGSVEEV